jgi:C-terminal processing protease CtpA/Prc
MRKPSSIQNRKSKIQNWSLAAVLSILATSVLGQPSPPPLPPLLSEIDRSVRDLFYDPTLKGVDWPAALNKAAQELSRTESREEQDAIYDRLLATLEDSHTFRLPAGRLPEHDWATAGLRIGQDGDGYAVKGVVPGGAADEAGIRIGDRILSAGGVTYGKSRVSFRDLFFVFEGPAGGTVDVTWQRPGDSVRKDRLALKPEEPGDALVRKSARVIRRDGRTWGYLRIWGMSSETALAVVDLLLDRDEVARSRPGLAGWNEIEGLILDDRGNSGGYDPNILPTFLRGQWSAGDYYKISRRGKRLVPPVYKTLPVALLINSGTASAGESLALKFRAHGIGPLVGETTSGMASGGAAPVKLSDGSMLWLTREGIESLDGKSYEGHGIDPDVPAADRPGARAGEEAAIEAAVKTLAGTVPPTARPAVPPTPQ